MEPIDDDNFNFHQSDYNEIHGLDAEVELTGNGICLLLTDSSARILWDIIMLNLIILQ